MKNTEESRSWTWSSRSAAWATVLLSAVGCAGSGAAGGAATGGVTKRDTTITHEACDTAKASEKIDANNDGRPDIFVVGPCRAVDLNFDGAIDAYNYSDASGRLRRREYDFDRDGQIDEIQTLQAGVLTEADRATSMARRLDTWEFYRNGVVTRSERDSNGDGIIDQWWEYTKPGCPMIHADVNNDGKPDPGATVDYCKETGYVPPDRQGPSAPHSPDFNQGTSMPTELDNKPADEAKPEGSKEPTK